jgi:hypothetical protein
MPVYLNAVYSLAKGNGCVRASNHVRVASFGRLAASGCRCVNGLGRGLLYRFQPFCRL